MLIFLVYNVGYEFFVIPGGIFANFSKLKGYIDIDNIISNIIKLINIYINI